MKKLFYIFIIINFVVWGYPYKNLKEMKKGNVRIIYTEELKKEAEEVLSFVDYQNENIKYIGEEKIDIPIILHPFSLISNAFVTQGPFRSEFYLTPPSDIYSLGNTTWIQDLSIHEYRHVLQMTEGREGINKLIYILGGELTTGLSNVLAIPRWYWEGDAVSQETALTLGGRGRLNYFLKDYRFILDEGINYSYEKAKNGSYKDYVPNHYKLGYLLTSYASEVYSPYKVSESFSEGIQYKYLLPFSDSLEKNIGLSSKELYQNAREYYKGLYSSIDGEVYDNEGVEVEVPSSFGRVFNYENNLFTYMSSYEKSGRFQELYTGKVLKKKSISLTEDYSYNRGYLLWDSYEADKLWYLKDYSNITIYNIKEDKIKVISKKGTYFTPSLGNTSDYIVSNKINMGKSSIVILDFEGNEVFNYEKEGNYYDNPIFSGEDKKIYSIKRDKEGKISLVSISIKDKKEETILPRGNYIIEDLILEGNSLYFSAQFDLVDNIYTLNLDDNKVYKLTNSKYGAYKPSVIDNRLYFSEYSNGSYLVKSSEINKEEFVIKELDKLDIYNLSYFDTLGGEIVSKVEVKNYEETDYKYLKNMINPHSWAYGYDGENLNLMLMAANELTDFFLNYTYLGNFKDDNESILGINFLRYWPQVSLYYTWLEENNLKSNEIEGIISFPLDLSKNYRFKYLEPSLSLVKLDDDEVYKLSFAYESTSERAYKNLGSTYNDSFNVSYINNFSNDREKFEMSGHIGTRGIMANDSLKLSFAYAQDKNTKKYSDNFSYTRAYKNLEKKYDTASKLSFDYSLPLLYPDVGDRGVYLKRIRTNFFYDRGLYEIGNESTDLDSTGVEVYVDTSLLSLIDITVGLRYSYRLDDKENIWELVIPLQEF